MAQIIIIVILLFSMFFCGSNLSAQSGSDDLHNAIAWLDDKAEQMIRDSVRITKSGFHAFPPQAGSGYEAFWLRDYEYMLEGKIGAFTDKELKDSCLMFVNAQSKEGAMVDCVKFDGTAIYKPGYGSVGQNPVADGSQFTVSVAWHTFRKIKDRELLANIIDSLIRGMEYVPRDPKTHLVHIDPNQPWDRCPYGFTDLVRKKGDVFFCSILYVRAAQQLADMLDELKRSDQARQWRGRADKISQSIRKSFWDGQMGLFRAATVSCREPDIWGSAYSVYIGVADEKQAQQIASYFRDHYSEIVKRGQLRHTPGGVYWEVGPDRETYQNGAYWGTASGWMIHALYRRNPERAARMFNDLVDYYQTYAIYECTNGEYRQLPHYVASATNPYGVVRDLLGNCGI